jgi:hypothetical protein
MTSFTISDNDLDQIKDQVVVITGRCIPDVGIQVTNAL